MIENFKNELNINITNLQKEHIQEQKSLYNIVDSKNQIISELQVLLYTYY